MKAIRVMFLILVLGLSFGSAQQPTWITLRAVLERADKQNLDLAAARARRAVALAGIRTAKQRPNPSIAFATSRDDPHQSLIFGQPLELGFKRQNRIRLAEEEGNLAEVEITALSRQVRRRVREAFYEVVFSYAESERLAEVTKLAQRLQHIAQERFEAGAVAQLEVIQAELEVSRAQADLQLAQQREKAAESQLNALLNEPVSTAWNLASSLEDSLPAVTLPELIQKAYQSNSELARLAQELRVEQSRGGLFKAERIPNLDVELTMDFNSPGNFRVGPRGQLALTLPIFTRNQGQIAQSYASQQVLEAEAAATKRAVAGRIEAAYFELNARQTQVELYRQRLLPAARRVEGLAEESYRAGKTNILAVLDAQRNVREIERNYLQSLLALQLSFAAMEESVGAPLE